MECADCTGLADAVRDYQTWKPLEILLLMQKGEDGEPKEVNLVKIIDEIPSIGRRQYMEDKSNRYYLTNNLNKNYFGLDACPFPYLLPMDAFRNVGTPNESTIIHITIKRLDWNLVHGKRLKAWLRDGGLIQNSSTVDNRQGIEKHSLNRVPVQKVQCIGTPV